jgi:hypothetical protein
MLLSQAIDALVTATIADGRSDRTVDGYRRTLAYLRGRSKKISHVFSPARSSRSCRAFLLGRRVGRGVARTFRT